MDGPSVNRVNVTLDEFCSTEITISEDLSSSASTTSDTELSPTTSSPTSSVTYPDSTPNICESPPVPAYPDKFKFEVPYAPLPVPPCPPALRPKTLPVTHPLSQIQAQFRHQQLMLQKQQQQQLRRMRQVWTSEKEAHPIPTDTKPVILSSNHTPSPFVLVPASHICKHCGAVNLLIKDPSLSKSETPK
jgi:hypothetical protein